jgi:hypothetical protein
VNFPNFGSKYKPVKVCIWKWVVAINTFLYHLMHFLVNLMNILIISLTHIQRSGAIAPAPNHTKNDLFMVFVLGGIEGPYLCIYREQKKSVKQSRRGIRRLAADQLRDLSLKKTALECQKAA